MDMIKTRRPEMYQNMKPPRKLCFILPSPAILFISPSPAISFISPSLSILLASNFVYFAKSGNFVPPRLANSSYLLSSAFLFFDPPRLAILFHPPRLALPAGRTLYQKKQNIQIITQFTSLGTV
jgi:hypothetical protein